MNIATAAGIAALKKKPASGGGGGGGGPAKIFDASAAGTGGGCTTSSVDSTGSSLIIGATGGYRHPLPTETDNKSNSWTQLTEQAPGGGTAVTLWYAIAAHVGTGHTFDADGPDVGTAYSSVGAIGFSNCSTFNSQAGATQNNASTIQPGSATGKVLVTAIGYNVGAATWSIDSGFTILFQGTTANGLGFAIAYKINPTSSSENPTWTRTSGSAPDTAAVMGGWD